MPLTMEEGSATRFDERLPVPPGLLEGLDAGMLAR